MGEKVEFSRSAHVYDLIYERMKNYREEAAKLHALIGKYRPGARSLLDLACGSGLHAKWLVADYDYSVDGVDTNSAFLEIAKARNPEGHYFCLDIAEFSTGRMYDVVTCLFGGIGYLLDLDRVERCLRRAAEHLKPGGVFILEPFLTPEQWKPGGVHMHTAEQEDIKVCRMARSRLENLMMSVDFEYLVATPESIAHFSEVHRFRLHSTNELRSIMESCGFRVVYFDDDLWNARRGLYVGTKIF